MTEKQKGKAAQCAGCAAECPVPVPAGTRPLLLGHGAAGTDWNNDSGWFHKQGLRGFKGEKGEPGLPGLDGLDAPCPLVWCTFPFLHARLPFGSWCYFLIPQQLHVLETPSSSFLTSLPSSHCCCQNQALPFILIPSCCQQYFVAWGKIELECGFIDNCLTSSFAFTLTAFSKPVYADLALHWLVFLTRSCSARVLH